MLLGSDILKSAQNYGSDSNIGFRAIFVPFWGEKYVFYKFLYLGFWYSNYTYFYIPKWRYKVKVLKIINLHIINYLPNG